MGKFILHLAVLTSPLLLTACGEGWEAQRTDQISPYGNQRTAGSGVAYVRAKMLPEKELNIESTSEKIIEIEEVIESKPVLDAEEIFTEQQTKSGATKKSPKKQSEEITKTEKHSSNETKELKIDNKEITTKTAKAEEYIAQEPKKIDNIDDHNEVEISKINISEIEPLAGSNTEQEFGEFDMEFEENETIEIYENEVSQPLKQIIVPKKDFINLRGSGKKSLDEIYNDDFISSF